MILVLLGTNPYPFNRLLDAVTEWSIETGVPVVAQTGHTPVLIQADTLEAHDFVTHKQVIEWIDQAEFIICQGGFGSLKDCISRNKPVIAVPRYQKLGECQDSQKELVEALEHEGCVIPLYDISGLREAITMVDSFSFVKRARSSIPELVSSVINAFIE